MARPFKKRHHKKVGLPPGSLVFVGEAKEARARLEVIDYDADHLDEHTLPSAEDAAPFHDTRAVSWINVDGVHDTALVEQLGEQFGIHPLTLEDIVHTRQRPKVEEYDGYLYLVLKMLTFDEAQQSLQAEQVSLVVGEHYVLSFQEAPGDVFDPVRQRLRAQSGRIRRRGPDYLAYALLDVIVDHYFVVLEAYDALTEDLEDAVLDDPTAEVQETINVLRRDLARVRRTLWPVRELFTTLDRSESALLSDETRPFLRDTYDHAVQALDILESLREMVISLHDLYMSALSNRMNDVMKVLTIIGTIFIPLTFIAGIYGMNFENMPELAWRYGYPAALLLMLVIAVGLLFYFRRKEWI